MKKLLVIIAVIVSILLVLFMASGCATPLTNTLDDVYRSAKVESDDSEVSISSGDVLVGVESDDGSEITVKVSDSLTAKATDGSKVYYLGDPTDLTTDASDGGKVTQK